MSPPASPPYVVCHVGRSRRDGFALYHRSKEHRERRSWRRSSRNGGSVQWGSSTWVPEVSKGCRAGEKALPCGPSWGCRAKWGTIISPKS